MTTNRGNLVFGFAAAFGTAAIWGSWYVLTRLGVRSFDLSAVVLLRYIAPVLVFAPVLFRIGVVPKGLSKPLFAVVVLTGGIGFVAMAAWALRLSPATEVSPIFPGAPPLFVALFAVFWQGERFSARRVAGFVLIAVGILAIILPPIWSRGSLQLGHFVALAAALDWTIYTVLYRRTNLGAVEATALVSFWCGLIMLPFGLMPLVHAIEAKMYSGLALQFLMQGVMTGIVSTLLFNFAVRSIGGPSTTAVTALSPVISALIAVVVLQEVPVPSAIAGMAVVVVGVLLANWPRRAAAG